MLSTELTFSVHEERGVHVIRLGVMLPAALRALRSQLARLAGPCVLVFDAAPHQANDELIALMQLTPQGADAMADEVTATLDEIAARDQLVAVVLADCHGLRLEVALACRTRIADAAALLGWPQSREGRAPIGGSIDRLVAAMGPRTTMAWLSDGKLRDANTAVRERLLLLVAADPIAAGVELAKRHHPQRRNAARGPLMRLGTKRAWRHITSPLTAGLLAAVCARTTAASRAHERQLLLALWSHPGLHAHVSVALANARLPRPHGVLAVVGTTLLAADMAERAVQGGHAVRWFARDAAALDRARRRALRHLSAHDEHSARQRDEAAARLLPTADPTELGEVAAVWISEATNDARRESIRWLSELVPDTTPIIVATPSAFSDLAATSRSPNRLIGWHPSLWGSFIELQTSATPAADAVSQARALALLLGRQPLCTFDRGAPGLWRLLLPMATEAMALLREGTPAEQIDTALVEFGFATGPLRMLDDLGLDVALDVLMRLSPIRALPVPPELRALSQAGRTGRAAGRGFYRYGQRARTRPRRLETDVAGLFAVSTGRKRSHSEIAYRCVLRMVNEAAFAVADGTFATATDADCCAVLGLGFPARANGPLAWADVQGGARIVRDLETAALAHGEWFTPAPWLVEHAERDTALVPASMPRV